MPQAPMRLPVYMDYSATTPVDPRVVDAMVPYLYEKFGNPASRSHAYGWEAEEAVEAARGHVAALLNADPREIVWTSGATEGNNLAIKGAANFYAERGKHIITVKTEHKAVLDTFRELERQGFEATYLDVDEDGLLPLARLEAAIRPDTILVSVMLVNNEIGVIQPIAELAHLAHAAGALFLCDAVQGYGRVRIPDGCDLIAVSAHKIHGPKGVGALWIRDGVTLEPLMHGGGQEPAGRSGTLSPALCAGFGAAARLAKQRLGADHAHAEQLFRAALARIPGDWALNGAQGDRYPGNLNLRHDGLDVARLMSDLRDIAFSAGSACASGSGRPSHVLEAIGLSAAEARASIRIGFGRYTTEDALLHAIDRIAAAARRQSRAA